MDIVIDTSALIAVIVGESERAKLNGNAPQSQVPAQEPSAPTEPPKAPEGDGNVTPPTPTTDGPNPSTKGDPVVYKDKAEVIAELEKRQIQHDKRKSNAELEKLLV